MKATCNFQALKLDMGATRDAIHKKMMENLAQVALAWVTAAEARVPVWTGASKATFLQLAHAIGFEIPISPSHTAPSDSTGLGIAQSEGQLGPIDPLKSYLFTYSTTLEHLIENEFTNANADQGLHLINPGPYHFQDFGKAAFDIAARDIELPRPEFRIVGVSV